MNNEKLKKCPCGKEPKRLFFTFQDSSQKWGHAWGDCCGDWEVQFKNNYELDYDKQYQNAVKQWNSLPRGF